MPSFSGMATYAISVSVVMTLVALPFLCPMIGPSTAEPGVSFRHYSGKTCQLHRHVEPHSRGASNKDEQPGIRTYSLCMHTIAACHEIGRYIITDPLSPLWPRKAMRHTPVWRLAGGKVAKHSCAYGMHKADGAFVA
jgi:hypothetical protein